MRKRHLAFLLPTLLVGIAFSALLLHTSSKIQATFSYPPASGTEHYLYVFPDGNMYVYDLDNHFQLVYSTILPGTNTGIRGTVASPTDGMVYVSYGGDAGAGSHGSLLKYNVLTNAMVWAQTYNYGIDSMAITHDGKTMYMPDGAA